MPLTLELCRKLAQAYPQVQNHHLALGDLVYCGDALGLCVPHGTPMGVQGVAVLAEKRQGITGELALLRCEAVRGQQFPLSVIQGLFGVHQPLADLLLVHVRWLRAPGEP
ncbi:MAG: hypothetical protein KGL39_20680 [Patescibacteria group bacterium]|nr:hypothetical protein [Patescibacteria group bacterium]